MDPTGDNDILQHQFRQSMIINLFGSIVEPPEPSDVDYLDILAGNVCMYICTYVHNCMYYVQALALHVYYYNNTNTNYQQIIVDGTTKSEVTYP